MKKISYLSGILIVAMVISLTGCKKDKPETKELVVIKRSTGMLSTVNKTNGTLTDRFVITYNNVALTGLRGLVYDPATGKCFAGSTNDGDGYLYSIDLSTHEATLLNDNADGDWDAIADMVIASDGNILSEIYSSTLDNSALVKFNKVSGDAGTHNSLTDGTNEIWSTGGLCYGASDSQLLIGGDTEIYLSNLTGTVSATIPIIGTANIDDDETYIMDLEKDDDGTVYGMAYEYNDQNQYLVKINTATGALTEIKLLVSGSNSTLFHCLAIIPGSKLE